MGETWRQSPQVAELLHPWHKKIWNGTKTPRLSELETEISGPSNFHILQKSDAQEGKWLFKHHKIDLGLSRFEFCWEERRWIGVASSGVATLPPITLPHAKTTHCLTAPVLSPLTPCSPIWGLHELFPVLVVLFPQMSACCGQVYNLRKGCKQTDTRNIQWCFWIITLTF